VSGTTDRSTAAEQDTKSSPDRSELDYHVMQLHGYENMESLNKVLVSCYMFMRAEGKYSHHFLYMLIINVALTRIHCAKRVDFATVGKLKE